MPYPAGNFHGDGGRPALAPRLSPVGRRGPLALPRVRDPGRNVDATPNVAAEQQILGMAAQEAQPSRERAMAGRRAMARDPGASAAPDAAAGEGGLPAAGSRPGATCRAAPG